jgi:transcriptional regulator with XRE-family HTH domain
MAFGERMREIRKGFGLNQKEMANKLHVSLSTLQRYEKSTKFPDIGVMLELILCGINIHWLITGDGEKNRWNIPNHDPYLNDISRWLMEISLKDPKTRDWFEVQFEIAFPTFKEWKLKKHSSQ